MAATTTRTEPIAQPIDFTTLPYGAVDFEADGTTCTIAFPRRLWTIDGEKFVDTPTVGGKPDISAHKEIFDGYIAEWRQKYPFSGEYTTLRDCDRKFMYALKGIRPSLVNALGDYAEKRDAEFHGMLGSFYRNETYVLRCCESSESSRTIKLELFREVLEQSRFIRDTIESQNFAPGSEIDLHYRDEEKKLAFALPFLCVAQVFDYLSYYIGHVEVPKKKEGEVEKKDEDLTEEEKAFKALPKFPQYRDRDLESWEQNMILGYFDLYVKYNYAENALHLVTAERMKRINDSIDYYGKRLIAWNTSDYASKNLTPEKLAAKRLKHNVVDDPLNQRITSFMRAQFYPFYEVQVILDAHPAVTLPAKVLSVFLDSEVFSISQYRLIFHFKCDLPADKRKQIKEENEIIKEIIAANRKAKANK